MMVFNPRSIGDHRPVVIHDSTISQVSSYKYLAICIDDSLTWNTHVDSLCSKLQQRLHFLRRLRVHRVDQKCMLVFYRAVLESLVRFGITVWFGNLQIVQIGSDCRKDYGGKTTPLSAVSMSRLHLDRLRK